MKKIEVIALSFSIRTGVSAEALIMKWHYSSQALEIINLKKKRFTVSVWSLAEIPSATAFSLTLFYGCQTL